MTENIQQKLGWRPQLSDARDLYFRAIHALAVSLPPRVDLTALCPPLPNQLNLGSCTANGIGFAHEFAQMKQKEKAFQPSRLFIYYNERATENTINSDAGAIIRDGFKSIAAQGVCDEKLWKYDVSKFTRKPPPKSYSEALKHTAIDYRALVPTLDNLKACLADGYPFVFGFSVYESFEAIKSDGVMPMPKSGETLLGGHCVAACGYDTDKKLFKCANWWGTDFGDKGYFWMPFDFMTNNGLVSGKYTSDFWTIRVIL